MAGVALCAPTPLPTALEPVAPSNVRRVWRRIVTAAGVGHVHVHNLRQTHTSPRLTQRRHLKVTPERLGHTSVAVTAGTYALVLPRMQAAAVA